MRAVADARLLLGLMLAGMDSELAEMYYQAVREYGEPHFGGEMPIRYPDTRPPEAP